MLGWILVVGWTVLLIAFTYRLKDEPSPKNASNQDKDLRALAAAIAYSIPISLTWIVLAPGHAACHFHIDAITFSLPFGPMFTYLTGLFLTSGADLFIQNRNDTRN